MDGYLDNRLEKGAERGFRWIEDISPPLLAKEEIWIDGLNWEYYIYMEVSRS